ncbi:Putative saccharopine dehydrogenase, NADP binding domain, NAD(P)-binding domain superfamily [Septoria linicola]|uniref:Saccharopine dehydrogenase, NADP binding domain, NAD(P)-binding domain superfamily n=1 Tax=Septoria linicola TaxID=215465 RepID=A0A9Q9APM3_9PEZI|nr:putative saccharopine dehydrogenase, NADP binding domain, NAD(P)-binding domain superfamily [Septoria linicola]USW52134.1 Putative saccharopine dehydrogenase, NADP binding domain, NAD(P)-binding domain superfamily [Septoria linicola]
MSESQRQYELVVFGATGYTGKYTAEHVARQLPTNLKWAIAGRTQSKLQAVADELRAAHPDREQPGIEISQLNKSELTTLAKKTKVLISTVGPFHKYGEAAFAACAETGTHYLDCTGEVPWVYDMTSKYHALAKKNGAIMIPQNGVESAPTDLICWALVTHIRETLNVGTRELIDTIYDLNGTPSGGTLDTVLTLFDSYGLGQIAKSMSPYSLSIATPPTHPGRPLLEKLTGLRTVPDLGLLTDSIQGPSDIPIVNRTWSLIDNGNYYGRKFKVSAYMKARNSLQGFLVHLALTFGMVALVLPPVRWLLKKFVYQPGEGLGKEEASKEHCEWRAIANADVSDENDPKRAYGRMRWNGSMYDLTGVFLAEAAVTIARDQTLAHKLGGGVLTPATLGSAYLERLRNAGLLTEIKTLP